MIGPERMWRLEADKVARLEISLCAQFVAGWSDLPLRKEGILARLVPFLLICYQVWYI